MANKLNKINFEEKTFESCGQQYVITEQFGYRRLSVFLDKMPIIGIGKSSLECIGALRTVFSLLTSGNDMLKSWFDASNYLKNFLDSARDTTSNEYLFNHLDEYLNFCALFCVTPDEDLTQWNEDIAKIKIQNWKKDMDMTDFFFLAKKQVPALPNLLIALQEANEKQGKRK